MNENLAEQLFFSKEAADYLGITVQRLNKLVQDGKIKPLKKNPSGTVYHISELNKRKEELKIFSEIKQGEGKEMFKFDTKVKIEALNYSTLMNVLGYTEKRLEPVFDDFAKTNRVDEFMDQMDVYRKYADFFEVDPILLLNEYRKAYRAFMALKEDDEITKRGSYDYPPLLAKTQEAPRFLYTRGKKSLLFEERTVALVGSRQASESARANTKRLVNALGKNGITIVSGLAKGIDVSAHVEALKMGFNTIAVIGTNLNQYYPIENKEIQLEIERKGVVVSQFSPASKTQRWFFPLRNGVMSGLSLATVIMEAGETSGALKQADFALKQRRQVLIPESALRIETISWPRKYVERGAAVVQKPSDVLRVLADNNIFRSEYEEPVQQMLLDYSNEIQTHMIKDKRCFTSDWHKPILVEG